tara:strand:- start:4596 stop:5039 length:444 start_codon:yes stop_codon:yes gene_type:complete
MQTKYTLEFTRTGWNKNSKQSARSQPLSICKNRSTLPENVVAKIIVPGHIGHGLFTTASATEGKKLDSEDFRMATKMTISPEMWDLLMAFDKHLDGIRSLELTNFPYLANTGLWDLHNQIKDLVLTANKIARNVRATEDDGITKFEM